MCNQMVTSEIFTSIPFDYLSISLVKKLRSQELQTDKADLLARVLIFWVFLKPFRILFPVYKCFKTESVFKILHDWL